MVAERNAQASGKVEHDAGHNRSAPVPHGGQKREQRTDVDADQPDAVEADAKASAQRSSGNWAALRNSRGNRRAYRPGAETEPPLRRRTGCTSL